MDSILPRQIDTSRYTESAQGFLTDVTPPDTSLKTKVGMAVAIVLLGGAAYYGYRLATRPSKVSTTEEAKKA